MIRRCFFTILTLLFYPLHSTSSTFELPKNYQHLTPQDRALVRDLILLNFPPFDWVIEMDNGTDHTYDVVIIGGGMAGLSAGAALFKEGIFNIKLFDQNPEGLEGPWITYARMKTLRSPKHFMGPALGIPHLTFHAWFEGQYGAEEWKKIGKIPNSLWMDYLKWYRQAMQLPVENDCLLTNITPLDNCFELHFQKHQETLKIKARKVVLATGRTGFGGPIIPDFAKDLPKSLCAHTTECIDYETLKDRRVAIIGVGASAFDAAATALEKGAAQAELLMRRSHLPNVHKFSSLPYRGFNNGFFKLNDEKKLEFMQVAFSAAVPPTLDSIKRVEEFPHFRILSNTSIEKIYHNERRLLIATNRGILPYDFLILATGFNIDGSEQPELRQVLSHIALWKDRLPASIIAQYPKLAEFPYLGPSYEFLPKTPDTAPYLRNLYCFNYGATMSHGLLSSDIPAISMGATRLAEGIAADFFVQDSDWFLNCLKNYDVKEFEESDLILKID